MSGYFRKQLIYQALIILGLLLTLVCLPLCGKILLHEPLKPYLQFPPQTDLVEHAGFSWKIFLGLLLFLLLLAFPFVRRIISCRKLQGPAPGWRQSFPWWGWLGSVLLVFFWIMAWTRFEFFSPLQAHTFLPIWLGFILIINALTQAKSGKCMLRDRPVFFLLLFPVSSFFWWFFEYLNRFVQNWHYQNVAGFSTWEYILYATLSFSVVLPAVLGSRDLLLAFFPGQKCFSDWVKINPPGKRTLSGCLFLLFAATLAFIGIYPDQLFPFLWISPLLVLICLQVLLGQRHIFSDLGRGDWSLLLSSAMAALFCGFFWEMWNYFSYAKWVYSIAYVQKFHLFEMPVLGYAGYLPFGLECFAIADYLDNFKK